MSTTTSLHMWLTRRSTTGGGRPTGFRRGRRVRVLGGVSVGAVLILAGCSSNSATSSSTTASTGGSTGGKDSHHDRVGDLVDRAGSGSVRAWS